MDVKDGRTEHITREPEQVRAFRDTWRDGIHSYLTYLRDRLTVARDLLCSSGSLFLQIGDENVHRVRSVLDEVFGETNFVSQIAFTKTSGLEATGGLAGAFDYILWYSRQRDAMKYRPSVKERSAAAAARFRSVQFLDGHAEPATAERLRELEELGVWHRTFTDTDLTKPGPGAKYDFEYAGRTFTSGSRWWGTQKESLERVAKAHRLFITGRGKLRFVRTEDDTQGQGITNSWDDIAGSVQSRSDPKVYVVQTSTAVVQRCLLMTTDPGDLVLDPTCGAGTTAYAAEHWGRRWITVDTSRVALALARSRLMGARYPYFLLADSKDGQREASRLQRKPAPSETPRNDVRLGFVYKTAPHITLKSIVHNAEIDAIWDKHRGLLKEALESLNKDARQSWTLDTAHLIPWDPIDDWKDNTIEQHKRWWKRRRALQDEIDASIEARADQQTLYDQPFEAPSVVRVAGPFTVESLSPHRFMDINEDDELIEDDAQHGGRVAGDFVTTVLEHLKTAGAQQSRREFRVAFSTIQAWPGEFICAEGLFSRTDADGELVEGRAGIFIGPEFGTVGRQDLVAAAREAGDADFDILVCCAFNYEAHATEFSKLGRIQVLKARMNADLHMANELQNTGKGNMFVIFGEPDIEVVTEEDGRFRIRLLGVDVFDPASGEIRSDNAEDIACWFIDTDYNEESFFVRHAYFLGANDPYKALKTTLRAEISQEAWQSLNSDISRPFRRPTSGRIAVKVINHLGDEVMKVFRLTEPASTQTAREHA